jgi:alpha-N-acetylglucosaminidase
MMKVLLFSLFFLVTVVQVRAQDFRPLQDLVARRIPTLKGKVQFKSIEGTQRDTASYVTSGEKLIVHASTVSAGAYALNDYLRKFCFSSFSHLGDNINIPEKSCLRKNQRRF